MAVDLSAEAAKYSGTRTKPPFLRRVRIQGFKSIAYCDVALEPLTVVVGRNGSGKSNFLDAITFVLDAMGKGLHEAVNDRHGLANVQNKNTDQSVRIDLEFDTGNSFLTDGPLYRYCLTIPRNSTDITRDAYDSVSTLLPSGEWTDTYNGQINVRVMDDKTVTFANNPYMYRVLFPIPMIRNNILVGDTIGFLGKQLGSSQIYDFILSDLRKLHSPSDPTLLARNSYNIDSVFRYLCDTVPDLSSRVVDYLRLVCDEIESVAWKSVGEYTTLEFRMRGGKASSLASFDSSSMSDGTLRALAILLAVFQIDRHGNHPSLIGIEEPETSLHPAAMRALMSAFEEATQHTQVIVTTHSADLIDGRDKDDSPLQILVARIKNGQTEIAPVDAGSREIVRRELQTYGDLQRSGHLDPDSRDLQRQQRDASAGV